MFSSGMPDTSTPRELLQLCLWDIAEGCRMLADRLPGIARHVRDPGLRASLEEEVAGSARRSTRLLAPADRASGPDNLWMAGILDDAERDTRSIAPGPLLDVAAIGAIRKALHSEIASLHTARAMGEACGRSDALEAVRSNLAVATARDHDLLAQLPRLAKSTAPAALQD